jgi:hypothetical protein
MPSLEVYACAAHGLALVEVLPPCSTVLYSTVNWLMSAIHLASQHTQVHQMGITITCTWHVACTCQFAVPCNIVQAVQEGQADNGKADKPAKHEIIADGLDSVVFDDAMRAKQNTTQKLEDVYELGRLLGRGGYANVYLSAPSATHLSQLEA